MKHHCVIFIFILINFRTWFVGARGTILSSLCSLHSLHIGRQMGIYRVKKELEEKTKKELLPVLLSRYCFGINPCKFLTILFSIISGHQTHCIIHNCTTGNEWKWTKINENVFNKSKEFSALSKLSTLF